MCKDNKWWVNDPDAVEGTHCSNTDSLLDDCEQCCVHGFYLMFDLAAVVNGDCGSGTWYSCSGCCEQGFEYIYNEGCKELASCTAPDTVGEQTVCTGVLQQYNECLGGGNILGTQCCFVDFDDDHEWDAWPIEKHACCTNLDGTLCRGGVTACEKEIIIYPATP